MIFAEWQASHEARSLGGMIQALIYIVVISKISANTMRPRHGYKGRQRKGRGREAGAVLALNGRNQAAHDQLKDKNVSAAEELCDVVQRIPS